MKRIILLIIFFLVFSPLFALAESVQLNVNIISVPIAPGGGGGRAAVTPSYATVIIKGLAYPSSSVTILKDGVTATTIQADPSAAFQATISNLTPGIWTFSVWTEDNKGHRSITFSFTTSLTGGVNTTISNIFLPPTIELDKDEVNRGDNIGILGQTAPESEVAIYVYSSGTPIVKKTQADIAGAYFYNFDTTPLAEGLHNTKSKSVTAGGLISDFSNSFAFLVLTPTEPIAEPGAPIQPPAEVPSPVVGVPFQAIPANINKVFTDHGANIVDIVDVSILLYNWGIPRNPKADLNKDNVVDLIDFSIILYYWTGSI